MTDQPTPPAGSSPPPLWMPTGSVRGLIALLLTALIIVLLILAAVRDGTAGLADAVPAQLWTAYGAVLGWYFAGRQADAANKPPALEPPAG